MKEDGRSKRLEGFRGFINLFLIIAGLAALAITMMGFAQQSIFILFGLIMMLFIVITYYTIAVFFDIVVNINDIREENEKIAMHLEKIVSRIR